MGGCDWELRVERKENVQPTGCGRSNLWRGEEEEGSWFTEGSWVREGGRREKRVRREGGEHKTLYTQKKHRSAYQYEVGDIL